MRKHDLNYLVVGLFIAVMLGATLASATLLTGWVGARDVYFTVLDNVADVNFGTQVRYEGFPVGQVEDITPVAAGSRMRFRVELSIERGWRIPDDSVARIGSTSFLAAKTIDIDSGRADTAIGAGGEIKSGPPSDMMAAMADLAAEFGELNRDSVKPLVERVTVLVERVGASLDRDLPHVIKRLDASAATLQQVLSSENAAAIRRVLDSAEKTSRSFTTASRHLEETAAKADRLLANLDGLVAENRNAVDRSLKDIQYTLSSIAQRIDAVTHNLESASRNMNEFSRLIRQNPGLLLGGTPREEVSSGSGYVNGEPR